MNDPNGLIYYENEWHLFYQHYPLEPQAKNIHWGHAVSRDMIAWTDLPIALTPDDENTGIWSGSAVIDWNNVTGLQQISTVHPMIAIYTWQKRGWQEQHMAYSLDRGRTWTKYPLNPIIPLVADITQQDNVELNPSEIVFRDPKVLFHRPTGSWVLVISGGNHVQFYTSNDLIHWSLSSRFGHEDGSHAGVWECPDLIEFSATTSDNQKLWLLIVSINRNAVAGGSGMQYFVGTFDGRTFKNLQTANTIRWLDYGPDFYAGVTYHNVPRFDARQIMVAWMNNWQYAQSLPTAPIWRGQMTVPRQIELSFDALTNAYHVRQSPVHELYSHSKKIITLSRQNLTSETPNILATMCSDTFMIWAEFHRVTPTTVVILQVRKSSDGSEYTEIKYMADKNRLELDRSHSEQRPWSEWSRSDESYLQHTGHDVEQVQHLYSMCEQPFVNYCRHRNQEDPNSNITPYLSPMNLLVVTLWYLKHYHSERYIAAEFDLSRSRVNYFLSTVVDILHCCVYPELVSLPADMSNRTAAHGPEEHHKLIVDSNFIAIPQPDDINQRKAYYHAKSPTNYALKIQISCDFRHRIVHVFERYHGSVHDITILRESGLLEHVNDSVQIIADKGYIGEEYVVTPRKKPHGRELTDEDKNFNRDINSARAAIENIDQRLKTYSILGSVYRGAIDDLHKITKIAQVVSALCNMNLNKHPIRK
ncbi:unnamed protein product [Rotaria sp. Silwood2]|nr:unnamed protein product [Rotaria sp. Silwood2]CAF4087421.1 unnamed protein product [Rotaria sp. Silwood2]